jgi:hypothetical protein
MANIPNDLSDIPKTMQRTEFCNWCREEMDIHSAFVRDDQVSVKVLYQCKCGQQLGFIYVGPIVDIFKKAIGIDNS